MERLPYLALIAISLSATCRNLSSQASNGCKACASLDASSRHIFLILDVTWGLFSGKNDEIAVDKMAVVLSAILHLCWFMCNVLVCPPSLMKTALPLFHCTFPTGEMVCMPTTSRKCFQVCFSFLFFFPDHRRSPEHEPSVWKRLPAQQLLIPDSACTVHHVSLQELGML